jgi:hypothetical protein
MTETQYEYPTTARRAFVNLAEAVRTSVENPRDVRDILIALANLHVSEGLRALLVESYIMSASDDREAIATKLAALLDGLEKFHAGRFIHHATSDSDADDDGDGGKWSYNRTHPEDALKTTIETDEETVVLD